MSELETRMVRHYWKSVGGTLVEEFLAVSPSPTCGRRLLDGVILPNGEFRRAHWREVSVEGEDIIVVQAKPYRLGMYLMGQVLFSLELMKRFNPASIRSVALCVKDDSVLRPLLEAHPGLEVVVIEKAQLAE